MIEVSEEQGGEAPRPPRKAERVPFNAAVQFRKGHTRATVKIVDISPHGARLSAVHVLRNGDTFWIKLPSLEPQEATVVWADEFIVGCEFAHPLHPSVFEAMVRSTH